MISSIKRALISVADKTGVDEFARQLQQIGVEIISTGGTAKFLSNAGIKVVEVSEYTGFTEILDGRVKTLHPKIHGGVLAQRDIKPHMDSIDGQGIDTIDLVCVNLYPFGSTVANADCTLEDAIENIDIGGSALIRSAAKNWLFVAIVTDIQDYSKVAAEIKASDDHAISKETLFYLAAKAFSYTARYDGMISNYFSSVDTKQLSGVPKLEKFSGQLNMHWLKVQDLRYGENPHQCAAFYQDRNPVLGSLSLYKQCQGKALSYNNLVDSDTAWELVKVFSEPACVIIKHANPCGVAVASDMLSAYHKAYESDKTSAFGGIIAFNREVDQNTIDIILATQFMEILIAPSFTLGALQAIATKKNVRVLTVPLNDQHNVLDMKRISGGLLVQTTDHVLTSVDIKVVSMRQPTDEELKNLLFLWKVVQFIKSNAVVFGNHGCTYGIGAGQMNRLDSIWIATKKAQESNFNLNNSLAASDAFFPFRDGVDLMAQQGIKAVIHPGGSIRDAEVVSAANEHNMVMVLTGIRHFRH